MYRVLFATNEPAVLEPLNQITNWQSMSFHDPMLAGDADEAIRLMESKRVDAIAYMLDADEARKLSLYLNNMRPSLPIFQIQRTLDAQKEEIINLRRLLDRLHADMSDEVYDEAAVLDILRDEVTHNRLAADVAADAQLRGTLDGMDLTAVTEIAEYMEREIGIEISPRQPFVGRHFNVTRAGIHADGLLKDEEIYNIFDTAKILNRPALVAVDATSGTAGVAHWLNSYFRLKGDEVIPKTDPLVTTLRDLVAELYAQGRNTVMGDEELEIMVRTIDTERYEHLLFHKSH